MKKRWKVFAVAVAMLTALSSHASAAMLIMNGYTESDARGVTLLLTRKGTDLKTVSGSDILWVDQQRIQSDGSFSIQVPLLVDTEYDLYTNALSYNIHEGKTKVLYVSASGVAGNSGLDIASPTTLSTAFEQLDFVKEIVLLDNITYTNMTEGYTGDLTIRGNSGTETLTLSSTVSLQGNLKIDNLVLSGSQTIYANGYALEIGSGVTSTERLSVYGGKSGAACASTDVKLYGGQYSRVYGGGYGAGATVTGNTNVILGGNVNPNDSIDDGAENKSTCYVYGGGNNAAVSGKTNLTLTGNAITLYLVGAGTGTNGTAADTNIYIEGGQVMNVYGGSQSVALTNCNTHITMTGGKAEALFGGCSSVSMTGNTYITLKGGEVIRRVYTGCYNEADSLLFSLSWADTDNHVIGTTNLTIYPGVKLATGIGLSGTNGVNRGIFSGSRRASGSADEVNTVLFLNGSYEEASASMGEQGLLHRNDFDSFENYTVNATSGGTVLASTTGGTVTLMPDTGRSAVIGTVRYYDQADVTITKGATTKVTFDGITSAAAAEVDTGVTADVGVSSSVAGQLIVAVYDENKNMASSEITSFEAVSQSYTININCSLEKDRLYYVKIFLWDGSPNLIPITNEYIIEL